MTLRPPALVISKTLIDKVSYRYLVMDRRYAANGFKDVLVVDSDGRCFDIEKVIPGKKLDLWYSIKLVGLIVRVRPVLKEPVFTIDVDRLKKELVSIVNMTPYRFGDLLDRDSLIQKIEKADNVRQLIDVF